MFLPSPLMFFLLGLILGSFANAYFFRISEDISLCFPRSFCPSCKTTIAWYDNIPVFSYVFLRGKCRACRAAISVRYPLVELGTALLFFAVQFYFRPFSLEITAAFIFFAFILFLIGGVDLTTYFKLEKQYGIIPDHLSYALILGGLAFSPWNPFLEDKTRTAVICAVSAGLILLVFRFAAGKILKQEALGLGDVKMLVGVAAWTGMRGSVLTLLIGSVLGTVISLALIYSKKLTRKSAVPFGPFLAAGALSVIFLL